MTDGINDANSRGDYNIAVSIQPRPVEGRKDDKGKLVCGCKNTKVYSLGMCRRHYEQDLKRRNPSYHKKQLENARSWHKKNPARVKALNIKRWNRIKANPLLMKRERGRKRNSMLMNKYGISSSQYRDLYKTQNGRCVICHHSFPVLDVDHDHETNQVRGLLCRGCNTLVGQAEKRGALLLEAGRYILSRGGGNKNDGNKLVFAALPISPLRDVVDVYTRGMKKYGMDNWRDGILWSRIYSAIFRHLTSWWDMEELDREDGQKHLASVAWGALTLLEYETTHPELDDRPINSDIESFKDTIELENFKRGVIDMREYKKEGERG